MKRYLLLLLSLVALGACAPKTTVPPDFAAQNLASLIPDTYVQKVDTFYVALDASQTMENGSQGVQKLAIAKEVARRMNETIPGNIQLTGGLQAFGPQLNGNTKLLYGLQAHDRAAMAAAIAKITKADGLTPMGSAIKTATADLDGVTNRIAMIVISDGMENGPLSAVATATAMKEKFGDRICIYTVLVGDDAGGAALMEKIANIGGCGFATKATDVLSGNGMADFVTRVFLTAAPPKPMAKEGDADRDGIVDSRDKCPNSPLGAKVDSDGCWQIANVHFDHDMSLIRGADYDNLEHVYDVMRVNPDLTISLAGHTSEPGTAEYNMKLSEKRAKAVLFYFTNMGITANRINIEWFGRTKPVADNATAEGQALNRRVEITPSRR
ncbi:MAG: OmpA family protein [Thermodesulfobacteriota bacterium]